MNRALVVLLPADEECWSAYFNRRRPPELAFYCRAEPEFSPSQCHEHRSVRLEP
jgi:hypothetical protein